VLSGLRANVVLFSKVNRLEGIDYAREWIDENMHIWARVETARWILKTVQIALHINKINNSDGTIGGGCCNRWGI